MKKIFLMFVAIAALAVSCQKAEPDDQSTATTSSSYAFDFNISGDSFGTLTKAEGTTGWTTGEKIFVFFQPQGGSLLEGYLTLTLGEDGKWAYATSDIADGDLGTAGKMSAVYVPFLSDSTVPVYKDGGFSIDGGDVYYSCAETAAYELCGTKVTGDLYMSIPAGYIQFSIDAATVPEENVLSCNIVDAFSCVSVGSNLQFTNEAVSGNKMTGHKIGDKIYFWGVRNSTEAKKCEWVLPSASGNLYKTVSSNKVNNNTAYDLVRFAPEGALAGAYSVSETRKVLFSKGNLQATYHSATKNYSWAFAEEQIDHIGDAAGNTTIDNQTDGAVVDLFGWTAVEKNYTDGIKQYGINTSISATSYRQKGGASDHCCDWGKTIDNNGTWSVLTKDEWYYLLFTRTVNGGQGENYSFVLATIDGVPGVILFYDDYTGVTTDLTEIPDGCAFLPGAGYRVGTSLDSGNLDSGFYWASTSGGTDAGDSVAFTGIRMGTMEYGDSRQRGQSVRLVRDFKI